MTATLPLRPGVTRARTAAILGAIGIDTTLAITLFGAAVVGYLLRSEALTVLAIVAGVSVLVLQIRAFITTGQSLGWWMVGVRLIDTVTHSAPGWRNLTSPTTVADLRHGRDPVDAFVGLSPIIAAIPGRQATTATSSDYANSGTAAASARASTRAVVLVSVDGGPPHALVGRTSVGRSPVVGATETGLTVPDLARTISKTHLVLEPDGVGGVRATDLGSTNGTRLRRPDASIVELTPSVDVSDGDVLELGDHRLLVQVRQR